MRRAFMGVLLVALPVFVSGDEMSFPELLDTGIAGTPKLSAPFLVTTTDGKPVLTEKHGLIAPALWDWDGDGLQDLLLGEFETNSGENFPMGEDGSTIRVYRNVGTAEEPKFDPNFEWARDTEGTIMEVPQWCCIGFTPYFYDLDDDGFKDMVTGQYHPGEVTWFKGSEEGFLPGIKLPQEGDPSSEWSSFRGGEPPPDIETFDYWVYSSASMGDFDDDGDFDLIVGGNALRMSENIGGKKRPSFGYREMLLDVHGNPLQVRDYSESMKELAKNPDNFMTLPPAGDGKTSPYVVDWDGDGVLDLMVTDSYRSSLSNAITYFRGVKTSEGHRFEPGVDLVIAADGSKALPGSGQRVYVTDWNSDGIQDLLIGASVATVNEGEYSDELSWEWEDVNEVESAGKDPGLYPPRPRPTKELFLAQYEELGVESPYTDEELEEHVKFNVEHWEASIGRLYRENKEHWLTMRHQGRLYVMLGSKREVNTTAIPQEQQSASIELVSANQAGSTTQRSGYPVDVAFSLTEQLAPGEAGQLTVDFDMKPGWYIYAPTGRNTKESMVETSVEMDYPEGIESAGAFKIPAYRYKGLFDIYEGEDVLFTQSFSVLNDTSHGNYELCGEVTIQTCKDDLCLPPKTDTYCANLLVTN